VVLTTADLTAAGAAALASPAFTGSPTAPTATVGSNNSQLATTQFVTAAVAAGAGLSGVTSFNTRTGAVTLTSADVTAAGAAPTLSPTFSGVPSAPTAAPSTNTSQLATTAFVINNTNSLPFVPMSGAAMTGPLSATALGTAGTLNVGSTGSFGGNLGCSANIAGVNITVTANGYKPGGGVWADSASDRRVKKCLYFYQRGLAAVMQLEPVTYQYNGLGNTVADGRTYTGLIAQDAQRVMPEMVETFAAKLYPDDVLDTALLRMDTTALTFALLNAVKELAARVAKLEENR
jgi:hypothetical protein